MSSLAAQRRTFRAIAGTVVPEMCALDEAGWNAVEATVERALSMRPEKMQRQLRTLLRVIEQLPRITTGRSFSALDAERRTRVLDALQHSRVQLLRRGMWGLRTLVLMGYYTMPATMTHVGYRADARGWLARQALP
jgi:hypothetical protein